MGANEFMGLTKTESRYDPNSKEEILKTIEDIFEKEKNNSDPKIRKQAIREIEMLKGQASGIIDSLSCLSVKIPEPKVPKGYRLPTFEEHEKLSAWATEGERLSGMIKVLSGDQKKEYIQERKKLAANIIDYTEKNNIYFVRGSNRFIREKSPP